MMTAENDLISTFEKLYLNGFSKELVPVIPPKAELIHGSRLQDKDLGKVPGRRLTTNKWSGGWYHVDGSQDAQRFSSWGANIGIETTRIIPIDFDINDKRLHQPVIDFARKFFKTKFPVRYGKRPLIFFRIKGPCNIGRSFFTFKCKDEPEDLKKHKVETFFGELKHFVVHGKHPDGIRYRCEPAVDKLIYDNIPEITEREVKDFMQELQYYLQEKFDVKLDSTQNTKASQYDITPDMSKVIAPIQFVKNTLSKIPNNKGRERWTDICHAIKGATQNNLYDGKKLWLDWCESREDGDPHLEEAERVWDSCGKQSGSLWIGYEALLSFAGDVDQLASRDFADEPLPEGVERPKSLFIIQPVYNRELAMPEWIVDDLVPKGEYLGVIYGQASNNKSTLVSSLCVHIALGLEFCGKKTKEGNVFLVPEEDAVINRRRLSAWEHHLVQHGTTQPTLAKQIRQRILEAYPSFGRLSKKKIKHAISEIQRITDESGLPLQTVFIDTIARTFIEGGEENNGADMNKYIDLAEELTKGLHCPVFLLHHPPKNEDTLRGHSSLQGAVSIIYKVERGTDDIVRMYCQKMRDAAEPAPLAFQKKVVDITFLVPTKTDDTSVLNALILNPIEWCEPPTIQGKKKQDASEDFEERKVTDIEILRVMCLDSEGSMRSWAAALGWNSNTSIRRRLDQLERLDLVKRNGEKYEVTAKGAQAYVDGSDDGILL